jgi:hypothetical protein
MRVDDRSTIEISDQELLRLANRYDDACRHIVGFLYEPNHVIRDLRKLPDKQVIWREKAEYEQAFRDQLRIEYMRYAMEAESNAA